MKKERLNTTIDLILLIFFTLSSIYSLMEAYIAGTFPLSLLIVCSIALLVLIAVYFALILNTTRFRFLRRVLLLMITIGLFAFSLHSSVFRHSLDAVNTSSYTSYSMHLVAVEAGYDELSDMDHQKIGYLFHDKKHISVFERIADEEKIDIELVEYMTQSEMIAALKEGQIQGCLASKANLEQFFSQEEEYTYLYEYKHEAKLEIEPVYKNLLSDPFTVLISGSDSLDDINSVGQSDLNMLAMVNPLERRIELISLPENLYVPNHEFSYYPDILTNTSNDGMDNTLASLSAAFGFPIDYYVRLNFSSFIELIDEIDGIEFEIEEAFCEKDENGKDGAVCLKEGKNTLTGKQALALARHLKEGQSRLVNQQKLVGEIIKKIFRKGNMPMLVNVINTALTSITTNLDVEQVNRLAAGIASNPDKWIMNMSLLSQGISDEVPCVSLDPKQRVEAYILSPKDLSWVYERYLTTMTYMRMDQFYFSLNEFKQDLILPASHEKLVTVDNYKKKIVEYFALEPYSIVYPIQLAEWEKESQIQQPVFDPLAPITQLP